MPSRIFHWLFWYLHICYIVYILGKTTVLYEAKEQAKVYLERIRAITKATGTTLLLFLPVLVLLLLEIQKHYDLVAKQVDGRNDRFAIADRQAAANQKIANASKELSLFFDKLSHLKRESVDTVLLKKEIKRAEKEVLDFKRERKEIRKELQRYHQKSRVLNDSLKQQLDKLTISVEMPLVKRTQSFSIRSVVVVTMSLLTIVLLYVRQNRRKLHHCLTKFIQLQHHPSLRAAKSTFHNYQLDLPFWVFPLTPRQVRNGDGRIIAQLAGTNRKGLVWQNCFAVVFWLFFLWLNFLLCRVNWDINYKVFHQQYSVFVALSLVVFVTDIVLVMSFVTPFLQRPSTPKQAVLAGMPRSQFIGLAMGMGAAFLFEPVYGRLQNGFKWFYRPRYLNPKKNIALDLQPGFYTNHLASKKNKGKVFYFPQRKAGLMRSVAQPDLFQKALKPLRNEEVLLDSNYLKKLRQNDLLRYLQGSKSDEKSLDLLNDYIATNSSELSLSFIDRYTMLYGNLKSRKNASPPVPDKVLRQINWITDSPHLFLPPKYRYAETRGTKQKREQTEDPKRYQRVQQDLLLQLCRRVENWRSRLR